jgi:hypothetical protein
MTTKIDQKVSARVNAAIRQPVQDQLRRTPLDETGFIARHNAAWIAPRRGNEMAMVSGITMLANFVIDFESNGMKIADDGFASGYEYFQNMVRGLRAMLNFDMGRLDCGFCDAAILAIWHEAGFTEEL